MHIDIAGKCHYHTFCPWSPCSPRSPCKYNRHTLHSQITSDLTPHLMRELMTRSPSCLGGPAHNNNNNNNKNIHKLGWSCSALRNKTPLKYSLSKLRREDCCRVKRQTERSQRVIMNGLYKTLTIKRSFAPMSMARRKAFSNLWCLKQTWQECEWWTATETEGRNSEGGWTLSECQVNLTGSIWFTIHRCLCRSEIKWNESEG